jgi:hypothetical protein
MTTGDFGRDAQFSLTHGRMYYQSSLKTLCRLFLGDLATSKIVQSPQRKILP